jgi:hypothetical protein
MADTDGRTDLDIITDTPFLECDVIITSLAGHICLLQFCPESFVFPSAVIKVFTLKYIAIKCCLLSYASLEVSLSN